MRRRPAAAFAALASVLLAAPPALAGADFDPGSSDWNGLGELRAVADGTPGLALEVSEAPVFPSPPGVAAALLVNPQGPVDVAAARRFLEAGGRLVLADDFGRGDALMAELGVLRVKAPAGQAETLEGHEALAVARPVGDGALVAGVGRLVTNHPSALTGAGRPVLTFAGTGVHLAVEVPVGAGRLLALADSSVLINNMLELPENRRFAANLLSWMCGGARCRARLHVRPGLPEQGAAVGAAQEGGWTLDTSGLDRDLLWLVSVVAFGLCLLALVGVVPGGGETAWQGGAMPRERERPSAFAVRLAALSTAHEDDDGRLLAAIAAQRARSVLAPPRAAAPEPRASLPDTRVIFTRLADRTEVPGGLAGLAGVLQELDEAPPRDDPYAAGRRGWTVRQALELHRRVRALEGRARREG